MLDKKLLNFADNCKNSGAYIEKIDEHLQGT